MKEIIMQRGKYKGSIIKIDDSDFERVSQHNWTVTQIQGLFYAVATIHKKRVYLHQFIMDPPKGMTVDHGNFDGLDNQRHNLTVVTRGENSARYNPAKLKSKRFHGVYPDGLPGRAGYSAKITVNRKRIYIGHYDTEELAARAYDHAAKQLKGQNAVLNFP